MNKRVDEMVFAILESPFKGDCASWSQVERNISYARACVRDMVLNHNEAVFASHLFYTQEGILDDKVPEERELGILCGLRIAQAATRSVFYFDRGMSSGMVKYGLAGAKVAGREIVFRSLYGRKLEEVVDKPTLEEIRKYS